MARSCPLAQGRGIAAEPVTGDIGHKARSTLRDKHLKTRYFKKFGWGGRIPSHVCNLTLST
jgi:hypothetical protein